MRVSILVGALLGIVVVGLMANKCTATNYGEPKQDQQQQQQDQKPAAQ